MRLCDSFCKSNRIQSVIKFNNTIKIDSKNYLVVFPLHSSSAKSWKHVSCYKLAV